MARHNFKLAGEYIELNVLLKLLALAPSGGAAKAMIAAGEVRVDDEVETRKTRKIRVGAVVCIGAEEIAVT